MLEQFITLGDKITILQEEKKDSEEASEKEFVSKIVDIKEENVLYIEVPTGQVQKLPLSNAKEAQFCIYTKRGLYHCTGNLIDLIEEDKLQIAIIKLEKNPTRSQRREYYRISHKMAMRYRILTEDKLLEDSEEELKWNKGVLIDISGGGASFICKEELGLDTLLDIKVILRVDHGSKVLCLASKVIKTNPSGNGEGFYDIHIKFEDINAAARELIIKYVFEEERAQLKSRIKD